MINPTASSVIEPVKGDVATGDDRVMVICIDAMSLDFAKGHLKELPVLAEILQDGLYQPLTSPADHVSASPWPTFASGDDPGVHGHYFPFQWDPAQMRFRRTCDADFFNTLSFEPFWRSLAKAGVPTIAFDPGTPIIHGPSPTVEVFNWSYQSSGLAAASDPALLREIRRRFGRRPIGKEVTVPKTLHQSRQIRDAMVDAIRRKTDATLWLAEKFDWRLFLVGFFEVHRAGHNLLVVDGDFGSPADPDALLAVYKAQDRELGRLLRSISDERTTFIVCTLHGMAPNRVQDHFMEPIIRRLNAAWLTEKGVAAPSAEKSNLMSFLRRRLPYRLQYSLAYLLGERVQDWVVNRTLIGGLDWKNTPSFRIASGGEGYIRLNIKGREASGHFEPESDELRRYVGWLKDRLNEIRVIGSNEPLFSEVIDTRKLHPGPRSAFLPDLIVKYAPEAPVAAIKSPAIGELHAHLDTGRGGNHVGDAFMIVTGPGAARDEGRQVRDIKDIGRYVRSLLATPSSPEHAAVQHAHIDA